MGPHLHIIDPVEPTRQALATELAARIPWVRQEVLSSQWLAMHEWDYESSVVVVRSAMRDVWPIVLKVRALRSLNCRAVVLIDKNTYPAASQRLIDEGAFALVDLNAPFGTLAETTVAALTTPGTAGALPQGLPHDISDRVLQVAALYTSRQAPTTTHIAQALNLHAETVRNHLLKARSTYQAKGVNVSSRTALRSALMEDGYLVGECGWYS